jgi:aminobenzoyl-glutamate utilization protein A
MQETRHADLVELHRGLHRHPESAWWECYTTSRIVEKCERIGVETLADAIRKIAERRP